MKDTETILKEQLAISMGIDDYVWLTDQRRLININIAKDRKYQTVFNRFYRFRYDMEKIGKPFYTFFEDVKQKQVSFNGIITGLYEKLNRRIEPSFTSKMLHTLYPEKPIWDTNVLLSLGFTQEWNKEHSLKNAIHVYDLICNWYSEYMNSSDAKKAIEVFDSFLPSFKTKISSVKKIDYLLWIDGKFI